MYASDDDEHWSTPDLAIMTMRIRHLMRYRPELTDEQVHEYLLDEGWALSLSTANHIRKSAKSDIVRTRR